MQVKPRLERKGMQVHKKRRKDRRRRQKGDRRWEERTRRKSKGEDRRRRKFEKRRTLSRKKSPVALNGSEEKGKERKKTRVSRQAMKEEKKVRRGRKERLGSMEGTKTKVRNRCVDTGNGRSLIRWFRKSGRQVRERGRRGKLEGVFRVSW